MTKIKNIIEGWKNVLIKDAEVEALALKRLEVCNTCPSAKISTVISLMRHPVTRKSVQEETSDCVCGACGCPLLAKTRSPEEHCPRGRWGEGYNLLRKLAMHETDNGILQELNDKIEEHETNNPALNG